MNPSSELDGVCVCSNLQNGLFYSARIEEDDSQTEIQKIQEHTHTHKSFERTDSSNSEQKYAKPKFY